MKRFLPALLLVLTSLAATAQPCTVNTSYTVPGVYPDTLPTATVGQAYSTDITFMMPTDTLTYQFTNFKIQTVTLPVGLNWICSNFSNGCNYNPQVNQYGCVNVSGTPLLAGFYTIDVTVLADLTIATGIPVTFQVYLNVLPATPSTSNNGYSMTGFNGCLPITVNFTNNNPGLPGYFWDFGNGNQTTVENPAPQVYTQPGNYVVHYEAYNDTTTQNFYTLTSIGITSIQNSSSVWGYPVDGNPDLFVIVKENGTPVYQSGFFQDQFPPVGWTGLNINMNPANTYVLEVWDEDDNEFGFGSDDLVGTHTMSLNGCVGCAANISVVDYAVTHTVVPPSPAIITDDTVRVYGYPGQPNIAYDSLNHILTTDSTQYNLQWYLNGSPILGSNAGTDTVLISGYYSVVAINASGCTSFSDTVLAVYCDSTWHPHITQSGSTLSTIDTTANTLQWYLNGVPINGGTQDFIDVSTHGNGLYTLEVTNPYGCVFTSQAVSVDVGIIEQQNNSLFSFLHPNPAHEQFTIGLKNIADHATLEITDITGRIAMSKANLQNGSETIDVSNLVAGVYFVTIRSGNASSTCKLVVQ